MSRFEHDHGPHADSPGDAPRDAPAPMESNADAEDSAANIAELVRRTAERQSAPGPLPVADPDVTVAQKPPPPPSIAPPMGPPMAPPVAPPVGPPTAPPTAPPVGRPVRHTMRAPSRRILVPAGAAVAVLIAGAVALSHPFGSAARPTPTPTATVQSSAPAGYAVKVTDVTTDCAGHARGRAKVSFEAQHCVKATRSLATGQVSGRPVLFVVSRIQMASPEAAATVKQVLDGSGTGNLNDLLRERKTFPGAPDKMPISGYASVQAGSFVTVAEAGFTDGGRSSSTDAALRAAAAQVAVMLSTLP